MWRAGLEMFSFLQKIGHKSPPFYTTIPSDKKPKTRKSQNSVRAFQPIKNQSTTQ